MIIVQKSAELVEKTLGKQKKDFNVAYRPISFLISKSVNDGLLVYNVMTKCVVLLDDRDINAFMKSDFAVENWFCVPADFDEYTTVFQIRKFGSLFLGNSNVIDKYTILTTSDCNARCFYCYEQGVPKIPMSLETADMVIKYVLAHYGGKKIRINWFGGEPLYNVKVIDYISKELTQHGVDFVSNMISNGYLFDSSIIKKAKDLWNLQWVQITLDGTEKVYNKTKRFIYKDINPFRKVTQNIEEISKCGITVYIRLNVDKYNVDDIYSLVDYIIEKYSGNSYIYVYLHQLYENIQKGGVKRTNEERVRLFADMRFLESRLAASGFRVIGKRLPTILPINACMADSNSAIMILPSGKLGRCEHYIDSFFCGDLENGITNQVNYKLFEELEPYGQQCKKCAFLPDCFSLRKCAKSKICLPVMRDRIFDKQRIKLENTYKYFINKKKKEAEDDGTELQC
jgi:radical SAM protein with 4Fe4S-binding SPASM domain